MSGVNHVKLFKRKLQKLDHEQIDKLIQEMQLKIDCDIVVEWIPYKKMILLQYIQ